MLNKIRNISKYIIFIILLFFTISIKVNVAMATSQETQGGAETEVSTEASTTRLENLAAILVIDNSGSMRTTDPDKLRDIASSIFVDLLHEDDYVGIIRFDTDIQTVWPIGKVESDQNKESIKQALTKSVTARGDTDYKEALDEAGNQLSSIEEPNMEKVILFLTDGEPDPDRSRSNDPVFMESYMNSLYETVDELKSNQYVVYSIGFSDGIRPDVLERISLETNGEFIILRDVGQAAPAFENILLYLKDEVEEIETDYIEETETPIKETDEAEETEETIPETEEVIESSEETSTEGIVEEGAKKERIDFSLYLQQFINILNRYKLFIIAGLLLLIVLLIVIRRYKIYKSNKIKGRFICRDLNKMKDGKGKEIILDLGKLKKDIITISFNDSFEADYRLPRASDSIDFEEDKKIITIKSIRKQEVADSKSSLNKGTIEYILNISMPGIIEHNEKVSSSITLINKMEFKSNGYLFTYINDTKGYKQIEGENILERKHEKSSST